MGICYIIGAGDCNKIDFIRKENDLVICADGGLEYAEKWGISPDIIVGDFDSYGCVPFGKEVIALPTEKDVTDTHYAVCKGLEMGYMSFRLYGMLGGRIDHTLANIQMLVYIAENGGDAVIVGNEYDITVLKNGKLTLNGREGRYISVFSYSPESRGVTIKGLKYEVENCLFSSSNPLGVSNEFTDTAASVEVTDGVLIIAIQK